MRDLRRRLLWPAVAVVVALSVERMGRSDEPEKPKPPPPPPPVRLQDVPAQMRAAPPTQPTSPKPAEAPAPTR